MTRRNAGLATSASIAGCIVITCSSCAVLRSTEPATPRQPPTASPVQHTRWAQLAYGRAATFAVCVEPACPKATPKTLASASASDPVLLRTQTVQSAVIDNATPLPPLPPLPPISTVRPLPVEPTEPVTRSVVVNFPFGSAGLTAANKAAIADSLELARHAEHIVISGRTDAVGDHKANGALALSRAIAVRNYFHQVAPDLPASIAIDAKGRCCFVASNANEPGRFKNRRVEIVFVSHRGA